MPDESLQVDPPLPVTRTPESRHQVCAPNHHRDQKQPAQGNPQPATADGETSHQHGRQQQATRADEQIVRGADRGPTGPWEITFRAPGSRPPGHQAIEQEPRPGQPRKERDHLGDESFLSVGHAKCSDECGCDQQDPEPDGSRPDHYSGEASRMRARRRLMPRSQRS